VLNLHGLTPIRIGTCSWADEALSKYFYPPKLPAKERLAYYAQFFDTVEVDSTYYRLPGESMVQGWADRTPDGFTMHVKAFGLMTRHPVKIEVIPEDLRDAMPVDERGQEPAEHLTAELPWRPVDTPAIVDRHRVAQILGQHLDLHRVPRHQPERLDVHREAVRRALRPAFHHRLRGQAVVRRVDLHRVEALRVVRETFLRRQLRRIEVLREGLVGPRTGTDANGGQALHGSCRARPASHVATCSASP
jgi:uncharacterized protein YecE (DUF72 family)